MNTLTETEERGLADQLCEMKPKDDAEVGRWFYAEYGWQVVVGLCIQRKGPHYLLRFRWGYPFRTVQKVYAHQVLGPAPDPRWLRRLVAAVKGMFK